jgi:hypothetical protein
VLPAKVLETCSRRIIASVIALRNREPKG